MTNETFEALVKRFYEGFKLPNNVLINENISPVNVQRDIILKMSSDNLISKYTGVKDGKL